MNELGAGDYISLGVLAVLLVLSGFFSSAETALTTVNRLRIRSLLEAGNKRAKKVDKLISKPGKMLSAILIGNNIVNISLSAIATSLTIKIWGNYATGITTGIITLLVLVFGEITPKTMATHKAEKMSMQYAGCIYVLTVVLTPIIFVVEKISYIIIRLRGVNPNQQNTVTEDELLTMVDVSHEEGIIESEEHEMITNVVDFGDSFAKDIMVPKINMTCADVDSSYDELVEIFKKDKYTRLPVYEGSIDNIIGIVNLKDAFFYEGDREKFNLRQIIREPYFTFEHKKTSELLRELKKSANPLAIIIDEYGATAGLVSIEDLVEEIVGEIKDEYDYDEEENIVCVGDNVYEVLGTTNLNELEETLGLTVDTEEYDSIAGHVISLLEHLPERGEEVSDGHFVFKVLKTDKNRVEKIQVTVTAENTKEETDESDEEADNSAED